MICLAGNGLVITSHASMQDCSDKSNLAKQINNSISYYMCIFIHSHKVITYIIMYLQLASLLIFFSKNVFKNSESWNEIFTVKHCYNATIRFMNFLINICITCIILFFSWWNTLLLDRSIFLARWSRVKIIDKHR